MILCCGEALIDMLPRQLAGGEDVFLPVAGGAVFNTAIGLGRLGVDVDFFCPLSNDMFGELLHTKLDEAGVGTALSPRVDRPSTLAFVTLSDGQARYAFYDENTALRGLERAELPNIPSDCAAGFFGGISLIGEPCGGAFESLMDRMHADKVIMMDPNIRTSFISDEAAYRARMARMLKQCDIVKCSDEDFEWLFPNQSFADAAAGLFADGMKIVLITRGSDNPLALTPTQQVEVSAIAVKVGDTIGAGDTFNAGFLAGLSMMNLLNKDTLSNISAQEIEKALTLAAATAAITVSRVGANPPYVHEVEQYLP